MSAADGKPPMFTIDCRLRNGWLLRPTLTMIAPLRFWRPTARIAVWLGNVLLSRVRVQTRMPKSRRWHDAGPLGMRLEYTP